MLKIKLLYKLLILIGIPVLALGYSTYSSFKDVNSVSEGLVAALYGQSFQAITLILNADRDLYQAQTGLQETMYLDKNSSAYQKAIDFYKENTGQILNRVSQARTLMAKNKKLFNFKHPDSAITAASQFESFDKTFSEWEQLANSLIKDLETRTAEPAVLAAKLRRANEKFEIPRESLNQLGEIIEAYAKSEIGSYRNGMSYLLVLNLLGILLTLILSLTITRSITMPMNNAILNLTKGVQQVVSASVQLSAASQQLSEGSSEQAAAIEQTSSTMEESASMVRQTTENTKQAALLSKQVKESSDKGNLEMQTLSDSMSELKKSSSQIAKIIKVIDEIAFQTNILALNAAIEAARAGEAGMGFAVVAEEVRNLAQRSAQAAKDTAGIIESNISLSDQGMKVTETVRASLADITGQAKKVSELIEEIAAASQEQYQGIEQVNQAISQMESITERNSATAQENAAAAEELNTQAQNIMENVQQLSLLITGQESKSAFTG
ncbi:MAG: hypothetical protein K6U80_01470 [Firmicutes bacterium]|nr:hypothetical protein [Bacillota bacterium]